MISFIMRVKIYRNTRQMCNGILVYDDGSGKNIASFKKVGEGGRREEGGEGRDEDTFVWVCEVKLLES